MAISRNNLFLKSISGKIGNLFIVRQCKGRTIISAIPKSRKRTLSALQEENRIRFGTASEQARIALRDPQYYAACKSKAGDGQSAFNVAVSEFLKIKPKGKKKR